MNTLYYSLLAELKREEARYKELSQSPVSTLQKAATRLLLTIADLELKIRAIEVAECQQKKP